MYFIETLTIRSWLLDILPHLIWKQLRAGLKPGCCHVVDGSLLSIYVAKVTGWLISITVRRLEFRLADVRDDRGLLIRLRIESQDLGEVFQDISEEPIFQRLVKSGILKDRMYAFIAKNICFVNVFDPGTLARALLLVQVCAWITRQNKMCVDGAEIFLQRRPWMDAVRRYASRYGFTVMAISVNPNFRAVVRRFLGQNGSLWLRFLLFVFLRLRSSKFWKKALFGVGEATGEKPMGHSGRGSLPRLAVPSYGHLNLNHRELHSDLFFWNTSSFAGSDILLCFWVPGDPLDYEKWSELTKFGIKAVVLNPRATTVPAAPIFLYRPPFCRFLRGNIEWGFLGKSLEARWIGEQISNYQASHAFWMDFFASQNIKIYLSWIRSGGEPCAMADALQSVGGVTAVYQRSYDSYPSIEGGVHADLFFAYSRVDSAAEYKSKSSIRYRVTTGYLGDHRFRLLRAEAQKLREMLRRKGVTHILAFFDENSVDDSRWHTGHELQRLGYSFLLGKVLSEPWLGLVIKPKVWRTLRRRLGNLAEVLLAAEKTGRCYVFSGGALSGSHPPAAAALAADIAIHGHLCAGTAGLEAALAGVPTLLVDREGWSGSPFYRFGVGRVVFTDWQDLWNNLAEHWARPGGIPAFGDWSSMLDELDPFRDGRAAERMGTYLKWLIDGFKGGLDRETVMADAAERYCRQWGWDKVTAINGLPGQGLNGRDCSVGALDANGSGEVLLGS